MPEEINGATVNRVKSALLALLLCRWPVKCKKRGP